MNILTKVTFTMFPVGVILIFIAAIIQSALRREDIADKFGYTGLYILVVGSIVGLLTAITVIWQK